MHDIRKAENMSGNDHFPIFSMRKAKRTTTQVDSSLLPSYCHVTRGSTSPRIPKANTTTVTGFTSFTWSTAMGILYRCAWGLTVDGWISANRLRLVVYPMITRDQWSEVIEPPVSSNQILLCWQWFLGVISMQVTARDSHAETPSKVP